MIKDKGLKTLIDLLKQKTPTVKVGILGGKNARQGGVGTNAAIGAKHEFGGINDFTGKPLPVRSFLRMPLTEKLNKTLEAKNAFGEDSMKRIIKEKTLIGFMDRVGILAVSIVDDAFETGGFGKWKPSEMFFKKNHQTLIETQQLRESIDHEVKK